MGASFDTATILDSNPGQAFAKFLAEFDKYDDGDWGDPRATPGYVVVWPDPVPACAVDWMTGWTRQHPPAGINPEDKWGPWLAFRVEDHGWHFFGWVNT